MPITDPTDISGCILWLDGSLGVTLTSGKVSTWADQSGAGNNWTQTTAGNRPTVATADLNGLDTIAFAAASSQYLNGPNLFNALAAAELFVVFKLANDPPTSGTGGFYSFGTSGSASHIPYTDGVVYDDFGANARKTVGNPSLSMSANYRLYGVRSAASDWAARLNGTVLFRTTSNTVGWNASPTLGQSIGNYLDGKIAAVYAYNAPLSLSDYSDLAAYVDSRFGLSTGGASTPPVGTAPSHGSELLCWLKADAGLTYDSLGAISAWADQSGNGNDAAQATTSKQPTYVAGGLNGRPSVRFVEAAPSLLDLTAGMFTSLTSMEAMIVVQADADPPGGDNYASLWRNDATSSPYWPAGDGNIYEAWGSGARYVFAHTGQSLAVPRFYNIWSASNDYAVILDETTLSTQSSHTVGWSTTPRLGGNNSDAYLTGYVAEVLFFNRKLTASERGQWRDYLSDRWGLGLTPSGYTSSGGGPVFRVAGLIG